MGKKFLVDRDDLLEWFMSNNRASTRTFSDIVDEFLDDQVNADHYIEHGFDKYFADVERIDKLMEIEHTEDNTIPNILFMAVAMLGEAGEFANVVKKIVRLQGKKLPEQEFKSKLNSLMAQYVEELVDVIIYMVKVLKVVKITPEQFDKAWDAKHKVLEGRSDRLKGYSVGYTLFNQEDRDDS